MREKGRHVHIRYSPRIVGFYPHAEARGLIRTRLNADLTLTLTQVSHSHQWI